MEGYSPREWDTLQFAIVLVGQGVAWADGKPKRQELEALRSAFEDRDLPRGDLARALFASIVREYDGVSARLETDPREPQQILLDAREFVDARAGEVEAQAYKATAYAVGRRVAEASGRFGLAYASAKEQRVLTWAAGLLRYVRDVEGWTLHELEPALAQRGVRWSGTNEDAVHAAGDPVSQRFYFRGDGGPNEFELIVYDSPSEAERRLSEVEESAGKRDRVVLAGNVIGFVVGRRRAPAEEHPLVGALAEVGPAPAPE